MATITTYNYVSRSDDDYRKQAGTEFMKRGGNFDILKDKESFDFLIRIEPPLQRGRLSFFLYYSILQS